MNQATLQSHIANLQTATASRQAILARTREIWRKARDLYVARHEYSAISDFFEWIESWHGSSIWAGVFYRDGVVSFHINGDNTTIHVQDTFRCETDGDDFVIPTAWLYADDIDAVLDADLTKLHAEFEAHQAKEAREAEAQRRAEYETLKGEFES